MAVSRTLDNYFVRMDLFRNFNSITGNSYKKMP